MIGSEFRIKTLRPPESRIVAACVEAAQTVTPKVAPKVVQKVA